MASHGIAKDDMEMLSDTGFIGYEEAKSRNKKGTLTVAGYDQGTRHIVYEKPSHFIDKDGAPADGMYEIKERGGASYSIKVTGNHQLLLEAGEDLPWGESRESGTCCRITSLGPLKPTIKQVLGLTKQPDGGNWPAGLKTKNKKGARPRAELKDDSTLYLMGCAMNGLQNGRNIRNVIPIADLAPAWATAPESNGALAGKRHGRDGAARVSKEQIERDMSELLGFWLGDGSAQAHKGGQGYVLFSQTKETDLIYLRDRLQRIGLKEGTDYYENSYAETATQASRTTFLVKRLSWLKFFFREFACKYVHGLGVAKGLGVDAQAKAAWRREHDCRPPTDAQIMKREIELGDMEEEEEEKPKKKASKSKKVAPKSKKVAPKSAKETVSKSTKKTAAASKPSKKKASPKKKAVAKKSAAKKSATTTTTTTPTPTTTTTPPTIIHIVKSAKWFWPWVWKLCQRHCLWLLSGLMEADGRSSRDNEKYSNCVYTGSVPFRDACVRLAFHAGRSSKYTRMYMAGDVKGMGKNGQPIIAKHDGWDAKVSVPTATAAPNFCRNDIEQIKDYDQGVWCVTMPTGNIVVRRRHPDHTKSYRPVVVGN